LQRALRHSSLAHSRFAPEAGRTGEVLDLAVPIFGAESGRGRENRGEV